jgi:peptidoglycan/xylan/chitin deacetylase (PgdA/CDA1 family)
VDDFFGINGADYIEGLVAIGRQTGVKFTAFPTGASLDLHYKKGRAVDWQQAAADGHVIGNHTYDHVDLSTLNPRQMRTQLLRTRDALDQVMGQPYPPVLMRPPFGGGGFPDAAGTTPTPNGRAHDKVMEVVRGLGYFMTMWTTDSNVTIKGQVKVVTPDEDNRFIKKIMKDPYEHVRNGSIILIHPTTLSLNGVEKLINKLQAKNYDLVTIPGLFAKG